MAYDGSDNEKIYCHTIKSKVITNKFFLYKADGDQLPLVNDNAPAGYYKDLEAAKTAAMKFDMEQLPLFVQDQWVKFYSYSGSSTPVLLSINSNHIGNLDVTNKTKIPHLNITNSTSDTTINNAKGAKEDVLTIYNIADEIELIKPQRTLQNITYHWSDSEFALLILNLNNAFGINLPTYAVENTPTKYKYNKVTGQWEKQESTQST